MRLKFSLGRLLITRGALDVLTPEDIANAICRHGQGDWGDLDPDDVAENEASLEEGFRLLSAYKSASGERFWVITEADRSVTTFLLPSEY